MNFCLTCISTPLQYITDHITIKMRVYDYTGSSTNSTLTTRSVDRRLLTSYVYTFQTWIFDWHRASFRRYFLGCSAGVAAQVPTSSINFIMIRDCKAGDGQWSNHRPEYLVIGCFSLDAICSDLSNEILMYKR